MARGVQYAPPPLVITDKHRSQVTFRAWLEPLQIMEFWPWDPPYEKAGAENLAEEPPWPDSAPFQNYHLIADHCPPYFKTGAFRALNRPAQSFCRAAAYAGRALVEMCLPSGGTRPAPSRSNYDAVPLPIAADATRAHLEDLRRRRQHDDDEDGSKEGPAGGGLGGVGAGAGADGETEEMRRLRAKFATLREWAPRRPHRSPAAALADGERVDILLYLIDDQPQVAIFKDSDLALPPRPALRSTVAASGSDGFVADRYIWEEEAPKEEDWAVRGRESSSGGGRSGDKLEFLPLTPTELADWHCVREAQIGFETCKRMHAGFILVASSLSEQRSVANCHIHKGTTDVRCEGDGEGDNSAANVNGKDGDGKHGASSSSSEIPKFDQWAYNRQWNQRYGYPDDGPVILPSFTFEGKRYIIR